MSSDQDSTTKPGPWRKLYEKRIANPFQCPDCGRKITNAIIWQHKKTIFHKYAVITNGGEEKCARIKISKQTSPIESE